MRLIIIFSVLFLLTLISSASAQDYYPVVKSYEMDIEFIPDEAGLDGWARVNFVEGTYFSKNATCYLHGELWVDSVIVNGKSASFEQTRLHYHYEYSNMALKVVVPLTGAEEGITFYYHGKMNPSVVGSPSNYMRIDNDGVFLRAYGYSLWFPIFLPENANVYNVDLKRVTIRIPADFHTVLEGNKVDEYISNGKRVTVWEGEDFSLFMIQCTAQRYLISTKENVHVYYNADSMSVMSAERILGFADKLLNRFAECYGGGERKQEYYIIEMPKFGDISSGNVTGLQQEVWWAFQEQTWAQRVLGHELVHPFVWVDPDRSDRFFALAIEGFPSYLHLPVLTEILGDEWYDGFLKRQEEGYLKKRETGLDRRGRAVPKEKPILEIAAEEVGTYKDEFVLSDRVLLFFNYLYQKMGRKNFFEFTGELFKGPKVNEKRFRDLIQKYLPGSKEDVKTWLETNDYPDKFHLR